MSNQPPSSSGTGRSRLAASAARARRRQLAILAVLAVACGGAAWAFRTLGGDGLVARGWQHLFASRGLESGPIDILVVGLDSAAKGAKGDLFMLARLDPRGDQATILSLPSGTQTTIPGFGVGELAQAPAVGGLNLTRTTVQALLGIPVDRAIALDPSSEAAVIDAAGGLQVDVPSPRHLVASQASTSLVLPAGLQHLDGLRAAAYSAAPAEAGTLSRVRQQQFILFGLAQQLGAHRGRVSETRLALLTKATGDIRPADAGRLTAFFRSGPILKFASLPGDAGFDGAWIPNPLKTESLIKGISAAPTASVSRTPMVEILFSPLEEKAASKLASELSDRGLMVVRTAPLQDEEPSSVVSRQVSGPLDSAVRQLMPRSPWFLTDDLSPYSADYTLTIGATPR